MGFVNFVRQFSPCFMQPHVYARYEWLDKMAADNERFWFWLGSRCERCGKGGLIEPMIRRHLTKQEFNHWRRHREPSPTMLEDIREVTIYPEHWAPETVGE